VSAEQQGPSGGPAVSRGSLRIGTIIGAAVIGLASLGIGGTLGTWQWTRAHDQALAVDPDPRVPLAEVMLPGEAGRGEGRLVSVSGTWADAPAGLIAGKEVDGVAAVLLVLPLTVGADATGTGSPATLGVLAGWLPEAEVADAPLVGPSATLTGYVRSGEGLEAAPDEAPVEGAEWFGSLSTASLAQHWTPPTYSYLVTSDVVAEGWRPLPAPVERTKLDLRSLTYAGEWWLFGLFAAFVAARYIRDNSRAPLDQEDS